MLIQLILIMLSWVTAIIYGMSKIMSFYTHCWELFQQSSEMNNYYGLYRWKTEPLRDWTTLPKSLGMWGSWDTNSILADSTTNVEVSIKIKRILEIWKLVHSF